MSEPAPALNTQSADDPPKNLARKRTFEVIERPKPEKIRVELNIEKWPAIWQPSKSKSKPRLRVFERELTMEDGTKLSARLEVSFNHLGTLTTEESRMYRALIKVWEDAEKPTTQVFFSDRQLARILGKGWGTNVIDSTTKSLRKLRTVSMEWVNSYYDKTGRGIRQRKPMTFLAELKIIERVEDGAVNSAKGYFRFDDGLLTNLLENHTKPFLIDEYFDIKSDIGLLLYGHLDLILANKHRYERCTKELFEDLGLQNPEYRLMHKRKRALEMSMKELVGRRISTGVIASAAIEKTQDKKDYKIVVVKTSVARAIAAAETNEALVAKPADQTSIPAEHKTESETIEQQARELVCYFHQTFHDVQNYQPRLKEVSQAVSLIACHGLDQARYIVDFSRPAAEQTKYKPQTFGGILQYTHRAIAQYDEALIARARARQRKAEDERQAKYEAAHQEYWESGLDAYVLDPQHQSEVDALMAKYIAESKRAYPLLLIEPLRNMARHQMRSEIGRKIGLLSFQAFVAAERSKEESPSAERLLADSKSILPGSA